MIPRKKRIVILVVSIVFVVLIILGILGFLFLKTDMFKTKETLFAKYLAQNINIIDILKSEGNLEIENTLNNNKYVSELNGKIEYTENIGTSDENKNDPINDVKITIKSNVDKANDYNYKDVSIGTQEKEDLFKLEYLNQNQNYGIRLNGIQQFVSMDNSQDDNTTQEMESLNKIFSTNNINSIFDFTEEEKVNLKNTYLGIIQSNVSEEKYYKQTNALITVNNKDLKTNQYYIKFTLEEYNNLYIKILEQISQDEIILSKLDKVQDAIKEIDLNYEPSETLRETFVNSINDKIEEIKNNNIGSDEVKICVYENNGKTVRTLIEKATSKKTIDLYNNTSFKIDNVELGENTNEQSIKVEKDSNQTQSNLLVEVEKSQNNEVINNIQLSYNKNSENNQLAKTTQLKISNEKYETIFNIVDNIQMVDEFEEDITLDDNNVKLSDFPAEQVEQIKGILNQNIQEQIANLTSVVTMEDYINMFKNLNLISGNSVELPSEGEITEIEKKRFNSQFEFFVSEDLTADNIKDLIEVVKNNFEDMKVLLKNEEITDLDVDKLNSNQDSSEYLKNISEILLFIKEKSNNEKKQEDTLKFLEKNSDSDNKYNVSIQYDDNGLTRLIRIKIQEKQL